MPQTNIYSPFKKPSNAVTLANTDAQGNQLVAAGSLTALNITAASVVKTGAGRVAKVSVLVAGSAAGSVNDAATTGAAAVANQLAVVPNTVGIYLIDMPITNGLVVTPGTGQTLAVSYS